MKKRKIVNQLLETRNIIDESIELLSDSNSVTSAFSDGKFASERLANFLYFCDALEISVNAALLIMYSYENGYVSLDDVRRLLHISSEQKVSMADYFRKKQLIGSQTMQEFFFVKSNPENKNERRYLLTEKGKISAQTLIGELR